MAGNNSVVGMETVTFTDNMSFDGTERGGAMNADGELWIGSAVSRHVRKGNITSNDNSIIVTNGAGTIDLRSNPAVVPDLHTAKWIVNNVPLSGGNQTSITAAIAAASPGDTIFIMPGSSGTYTENITLPANINLVAMEGDQTTPHVTIIGTVTMTAAGTSSIGNIRLQTNGSFAVAVTGSAASILYLNNCFINVTNNTGISFTSSNAGAGILLFNCKGNIATTGIAYFASSSAGVLQIIQSHLSNSGASVTNSTISAGTLSILNSEFFNAITTSGTAVISADTSIFFAGAVTPITHNSTAINCQLDQCQIVGGGNAAVSIGAGATLNLQSALIQCTNPNTVTGAGTLFYTPMSFNSTGITINPAVETAQAFGPRMYVPRGISFDNTNFLANYATGTFVPVIFGTTGAGTATYVSQVGRYTRIGNRLFYFVVLNFNTFTGTGEFRMSGLPFTVNANDGSSGVFSQISTLATGASTIPMIQAQASNNNLLFATYNPTTAAYAGIPVVAAATFVFSGSYEI